MSINTNYGGSNGASASKANGIQLDPQTQNGEVSLEDKLYKKLVEIPPDSHNYFIPNPILQGHLLDQKSIRDELAAQSQLNDHDLDVYSLKISEKCRRLLAVLLIGAFKRTATDSIIEFVNEGITDKDLPFSRHTISDPKHTFMLCSQHHKQHKHPCAFKVMRIWSNKDVDEFCKKQWVVQSPVFDKPQGKNVVPHYTFDANTVLPFIETYEHKAEYSHRGGYSEVWPVRIAAGHQTLYASDDAQVRPKLTQLYVPTDYLFISLTKFTDFLSNKTSIF